MQNPLKLEYTETLDRELVERSLEGDRKSLERLIQLHQSFIYNVAWKMVHDPHDAMDLTQEVLIKVITKLSQFKFNSSFRTWLYRIVVNEFLQGKRRKMELEISSFDELGRRLEAIPNPDLTREEEMLYEELSREMKVRCMSGMLMCLNREQRLIYILADTYGIDHKLGAEVFDISPQNYRVKLHRARKELFNYMSNKCGLINKANPCRCSKKAKALKGMGVLDENKMIFTKAYREQIAQYAETHSAEACEKHETAMQDLFQSHPVRTQFDKETIIDTILKESDYLKYFQ